MKRFLRDQRGGGGLEVLLAVIILMFIFLWTNETVIVMYKNQVLEQAKMKGLDAMQTKGGLTAEIETAVRDYLTGRGFDNARLSITGTIATVQWGDEIALEIEYQDQMKTYRRIGLLTIERVIEPITYHLYGSTTSYYFDNN